MWAEFNEVGYPIIEVSMKGTIKNDQEFKEFTDKWLSYYELGRPFVFIFDTTQVGFVNIKYAFKMASFIKELKKRENQILKYNVIVTKSLWVKMLLKMIFAIQSPVAPVEMRTDFEIDLENLLNKANQELQELQSL